MDITFFILILLATFFVLLAAKTNIVVNAFRIGTFLMFAFSIIFAISFLDYDNAKFRYPKTTAFIYNQATDNYYIENNGEILNCEEYIPGFYEGRIKQPDFDSCYVYEAIRPKLLGFFENKWFSEKYQFRQGRDVILDKKIIKEKAKLK